MNAAFPRFFYIGGRWLNSYQVLLCVGIYVGSLTTAAFAQHSGLSPLKVGLASAMCALAGLLGARFYHVLIHADHYLRPSSPSLLWDRKRGGWSVFGALITFVPATVAAALLIGVPLVDTWDVMSSGVLAGGFWVRMGCLFNGCCGGRATQRWFGVRLHDTHGVKKRRVPVQYLEMAWWLIGGAIFLWAWPLRLAPGSSALAVLAWYGAGRCCLEPMREHVDVVFGRVRINQLVAALLALGCGGALLIRTLVG